MTAITLGAAVAFLRRGRAEEPAAPGEVALKNPFSLTAAIKFGLMFAAVLLVVAAVERYLPGKGYYLVAALANALVKCGLVVATASGKLRRSIVAVTAVLVVAGVAAILLG